MKQLALISLCLLTACEKEVIQVVEYAGYEIVVAGDSIAEGHPASHGPLHDGSETNTPGQIGYYIEEAFKKKVFNAGIGGQNSYQLKSRWGAVLALNPKVIIINVGINDVFNGLDPKSNYEYFASSCKEKDIKLLICNLGAHQNYNATKLASAISINQYLDSELKAKFPDVEIIDYLGWSTDGTYEYKSPRAGLFEDAVHPNPEGYKQFSKLVINHLQSYYNNIVQ